MAPKCKRISRERLDDASRQELPQKAAVEGRPAELEHAPLDADSAAKRRDSDDATAGPPSGDSVA
jgi:hypothetical protein